jgi:hypothetical protein
MHGIDVTVDITGAVSISAVTSHTPSFAFNAIVKLRAEDVFYA